MNWLFRLFPLHSLKMELEKLAQEKSEMQRHYVMYYEMSYGLNVEMHKQVRSINCFKLCFPSQLDFPLISKFNQNPDPIFWLEFLFSFLLSFLVCLAVYVFYISGIVSLNGHLTTTTKTTAFTTVDVRWLQHTDNRPTWPLIVFNCRRLRARCRLSFKCVFSLSSLVFFF